MPSSFMVDFKNYFRDGTLQKPKNILNLILVYFRSINCFNSSRYSSECFENFLTNFFLMWGLWRMNEQPITFVACDATHWRGNSLTPNVRHQSYIRRRGDSYVRRNLWPADYHPVSHEGMQTQQLNDCIITSLRRRRLPPITCLPSIMDRETNMDRRVYDFWQVAIFR